jgi:hypothetical protein
LHKAVNFQVVYLLGDSEVDGIGDMFLVTRTHDGKGVVQLIGDPDFEKKPIYQLKILATDRDRFYKTPFRSKVFGLIFMLCSTYNRQKFVSQ